MKKQMLALLLGVCLLLSMTAISALAAPMDGNVGDDNGVVTEGEDTGLLRDVTTTAPTTTTAPGTTTAPTTTTVPGTTTAPVTTSPITTAGDAADDSGSVLGIVIAAIIAAAVVALAVIFIPKMRKGNR